MAKQTEWPQDYQLHFWHECDILTNCIIALAEYRTKHGEYWPGKIIVNRDDNRLSIGFGDGIQIIKPGPKETNWPLPGAIYMSVDDKLRDPATHRRAIVMTARMRQPVEDYSQVYYRRRTGSDVGYVLKLEK